MKTQIFEHDAYGKKLVRIVRIDYDRSVLFFDDDTYLTTETRESPPLTLVQLSERVPFTELTHVCHQWALVIVYQSSHCTVKFTGFIVEIFSHCCVT